MNKLNLKDLQHKQDGGKTEFYNYKGIPILSAPGIHEELYKSFCGTGKGKSAKILVLGSGAGAFEQRLLDNGYSDITSVEFVPEKFLVKGTKFLPIDLNDDFSNLGKFDAVFAIEIVEHLENQFHFVRCVKKLLADDGVFYLSTPNVGSTHSRMRYFLVGFLRWFDPSELFGTGHINPIFDHILQYNLSRNDLKIAERFANRSFWKEIGGRGLKGKLLCLVVFMASFYIRRKDSVEINLYKITNT